MNRLTNCSGQALLLVIMVTQVILLMSFSILTQGGESSKATFEEGKSVQAYYIAEAGAEMAIAKIKNDPQWLKDLAVNTGVVYLSSSAYAGGEIAGVTVKRTSGAVNPTTFYIKSLGKYQGARRTIEVCGQMYDPVDYSRGVWVKSSSAFTKNSTVNSNVTAMDALTFTNNSTASGLITAAGDVSLGNNMTAGRIIAGRDVIVADDVRLTMEVDAGRDVLMGGNSRINGVVNAVRNVSVGSGAMIGYWTVEDGEQVFCGKDVYFNGSIVNDGLTGNQHPGDARPVNVSLPAFPALDQEWYVKNADRILQGNLTGLFNVDGILYAPGNISLSGTYSGNGAIVTGGRLTISGDLSRADEGSSLALIAFGNDGGVGIEVGSSVTTHTLLYCTNRIKILNGSRLHGSVVCDQVDLNNAVIAYEDSLQKNQPEWITTSVRITSWKEKYPVF